MRFNYTDPHGILHLNAAMEDFMSTITVRELEILTKAQVGDGSAHYRIQFARSFGTKSIVFQRVS